MLRRNRFWLLSMALTGSISYVAGKNLVYDYSLPTLFIFGFAFGAFGAILAVVGQLLDRKYSRG